MKKYILILVLALVGCSSLKTTDQRAFTWNGDAAVAYMKVNAQARQRADADLTKMLKDFPAKTFDLQIGITEIRPVSAYQAQITVPIKMNFKREWLINFWQHLYALNQDDGGVAQITVKSLYDMYDTKDVYNQADVVQGTVTFGDLGRFQMIQQRMISTRPNILITLSDAQNRVIWSQIVDTPALSHSNVYAGVPVFVDVGNRSNYTRFDLKWPKTPYQMTIDGHSPIFTAADIVVDNRIATQTRKISATIVLQNQ
jgi:hypothetical protein